MAKASIITVTLEGQSHLDNLIPSLLTQNSDNHEFEILVMNNGRDDGCREFIEGKYSQVRVIELGRNLGFASPVNRGVDQSEGEYIVFVNDDCWVLDGWMKKLPAWEARS